MTGQPVSTVQEAPGQPRAAWLDNLRVVLIGGVIIAHAATAYIVEVNWYYEERTANEAIRTAVTFPVFTAGVFGLGPLFLIAGMLSARSVRRRGAGGFARTRLLRLGVPLLVFVALIDPVADFLGGLLEEGSAPLGDYLLDRTETRDFGPMWFVAALLLCTLLLAAWRALRPAPPPRVQRVSSASLLAFAAGISATSWLIWLHWTYVSDTPFNINIAHWGQAGGLFLLGVCAGDRGWLDTFSTARARRMGWIALLGVILIAGLAGYTLANDTFESTMAGGPHWESAAFAVLAGVVAVCFSLWITEWFRRRWNRAGPLAVKAGRGSYAAYLIHPITLVLVSLACAELPLAPELKFLVVAGLGVPATFAVGYGLTRLPGVRRVL
jgi:glucan biosynthesis protein C